VSPLVISAAKHKIFYSFIVQLLTFSVVMQPQAAERSYEMVKLFL
jgi:hypothetical protein